MSDDRRTYDASEGFDARGASGDSAPDAERERRLDELISRYIDRLIDGESLDLDALRIEHGDLGDELAGHLGSFIERNRSAPRVAHQAG